MKERIKLVMMFFIIGGLCFSLGYGYGFSQGISWAVDIGLNFIDIQIDEQMIKQGIFNYKNNIGQCFNGTSLLSN